MPCWPWFSPSYRALDAQSWTGAIVPSGCGVDAGGNVACPQETIRANAETWLAQHYPQALAQIGGRLSQETYTYARYMHSEMGSGTVEERVAVGEALRNRAKMGRTISQLLTPNGYYGPIHAPDAYCQSHGYNCSGKTNVCCAPYGRWAATTRDPSVMTILLAALVTGGSSGNFTGGADDQAGPQAWIGQGQAALTGYVQSLAKNGKYWAGPITGVDHWKTFLTITPNALVRAATGSQLLQRGIDALALPRQSPTWPAELPVCGKPLPSGVLLAVLGAGSAIVLWKGAKWWAARHNGRLLAI